MKEIHQGLLTNEAECHLGVDIRIELRFLNMPNLHAVLTSHTLDCDYLNAEIAALH
jgi:hypothetical protein